MSFQHALHKMEAHSYKTFGVGDGTKTGVPALLNGHEVRVTTSTLEVTQPFQMGGRQDQPTQRVSLPRAVWEMHRLDTMGKNRFDIGQEQLRAIRYSGDPLSSEVSLDCAAVDM